MVKSTLIFRYDGLPLSGSVDDDNDPNLLKEKKNIKLLINKVFKSGENLNEATIESTFYNIHYLISQQIIYFVICEKSYPRNLAFSYLSEISQEFFNSYGNESLNNLQLRPFAFLSFDSFLNKTKKIYSDRSNQDNLNKINNELNDVKKIISKNIEDLLYRGDNLNKMNDISENLKNSTKKYKNAAKRINLELLIKQYLPIVILGFFLVFLIWYMFF